MFPLSQGFQVFFLTFKGSRFKLTLYGPTPQNVFIVDFEQVNTGWIRRSEIS